MPFCTHCGAQYEEGARFCTKCGSKIESKQENNSQNEATLKEAFDAIMEKLSDDEQNIIYALIGIAAEGVDEGENDDDFHNSEKLNLKKISKQAQRTLKKWFNHFDIEFDRTDDGKPYLHFNNNITIENHDDDISFSVVCTDKGVVSARLTFDKIEKSRGNLALINKFNENSAFFHAFVDSNDEYMILEFLSFIQREEDFPFLLDKILHETVDLANNDILQALTELTE